jgi:hypothetical protein
MAAAVRSLGRINPATSALLLCDMQVHIKHTLEETSVFSALYLSLSGKVPSDDLPLCGGGSQQQQDPPRRRHYGYACLRHRAVSEGTNQCCESMKFWYGSGWDPRIHTSD